MIFQLTFAICLGVILSFFFQPLSYLSTVSHNVCLSLAPLSNYQTLNQAIVCGKKISQSSSFQELSHLGIVHIIVVSGAHLAILFQLLNSITLKKAPKIFILILLFIFVLCCQMQPPVLRAWVFLIVKHISNQLKLFNPTPFNILLSVVFCLSILPQSFFYISLPMSWLACLAIYRGSNIFTQSTLCYFFIIPMLMNFQILHPWTIAINTLVTPLLCLVLFPVSFLSFFIPPLAPLSDWLWQSLFLFSNKISPLLLTNKQLSLTLSSLFYWTYPLCINLYLIYKKRPPRV